MAEKLDWLGLMLVDTRVVSLVSQMVQMTAEKLVVQWEWTVKSLVAKSAARSETH